jgi:hypothetical protein
MSVGLPVPSGEQTVPLGEQQVLSDEQPVRPDGQQVTLGELPVPSTVHSGDFLITSGEPMSVTQSYQALPPPVPVLSGQQQATSDEQPIISGEPPLNRIMHK